MTVDVGFRDAPVPIRDRVAIALFTAFAGDTCQYCGLASEWPEPAWVTWKPSKWYVFPKVMQVGHPACLAAFLVDRLGEDEAREAARKIGELTDE